MKDNVKHIVEKQTTKKGSKVDAVNLDGEELKAILEEKLGTDFIWSDYTWDATASVNGVNVYLKFVESDNGNSYEIGYHKDGSIHDRSVWKDNSKEAFEVDSDALKAELDEYGAGDSSFESEDTSDVESEPTEDSEFEDDFESDDTPDESEEELDFDNFGESVKRASERARLAEERERIAAKVKKESELRGHFEVHEAFKKYEGDTLNELFEKVGKKELVAKYLKEDKKAKDVDCMIDECNQKRLFCFLKREKIEF